MIQEFYISVTPVGEEEYLVRTERVAPGVPLAEEQFTWQIEAWILQTQQLMDDPLLSVLQGGASPIKGDRQGLDPVPMKLQPTQPLLNLTALGQQLYNALFQATIRDSWMTAQGIAYHRREALRLRLGLKGPRLPCLPWEVLHAGNRPIATGTDLVFSRYQPTFTPLALPLSLQGGPGREVEVNSPILKILMVIAAPTDQESLELKQEVKHLQAELQQPVAGNGNGKVVVPQIQLTILDQPDREHLTQALEQGHYQVLHYAGHSNLAAAGGNLYLVSRRTGLSETLSGDDLAGLLVNNGIQMAVFNSCRGAYALITESGDNTRELSLAEALVKRGIPAVLAMAERIPDDVALTLTRLFYRNLKQGYPVDLSLSRARQGLVSAYGSQQLYWALPILHLHPEFDGYLMPGESAEDPHGSGRAAEPSSSVITNHVPLTPESRINGSTLVDQLTSTHYLDYLKGSPINGSGVSNHGTDPILLTPGEPPVVEPVLEPEPVKASFFQDEADLADLVDDLEYDSNLGLSADVSEVSDLIRQLSHSSLDEDLTVEEPIVFAPRSESLLPKVVESQPHSYLELPENPIYRATASALTISPDAVKLLPFVSYHWQTKGFTRIRCIPFTEWRTVLVKRLALEHLFATADSTEQRLTQPAMSHLVEKSSNTLVGDGRTAPSAMGNSRVTSRQTSPLLSVLVGATVTGLILAGTWVATSWLGRQVRIPGIVLPFPPSQPSDTNVISPEARAKNAAIATQAIADFRKNNLKQGQQAVELLLNRGALEDATRVLSTVKTAPTNATTSFLQGRLALQGVKANQPNHSLGEAQRFFEAATQVSNSPQAYYNALAFTYYAGKKFDRAHPLLVRGYKQDPEVVIINNKRKLTQEELTACAGLALVFVQLAQKVPPESKAGLLKQAIELRNQVMAQNSKEFQPEVLNQNWMWSKQAVADWRSLLQLKP